MPAELREKDRLRARAWSMVRRGLIDRTCIEDACTADRLTLRVLDTDDGVLAVFSCGKHALRASRHLADEQAAAVRQRRDEFKTLSRRQLSFEEAVEIARTKFASEYESFRSKASRVGGIPIPIPEGSPLYCQMFVRLISARLDQAAST